MMLKVNGEYLDFNGDIEIEKKIKLFEDISTTDGDLSFAFEIQLTSNNQSILGIPVPDSASKTVYQLNECIVQNNEGVSVNNGSLRIERIIGYYASCSFLGGNSNWFALLDGNMTDLSLSQYDREQTETEIVNSWADTEGIIFPFLDSGALITRKYPNAKTEDFFGSFYLHTLFKEVFKQSGIKITGDLLNDSLFNQIIIAANGRSTDDVDIRSVYAGLTGFGGGGLPILAPYTGFFTFGDVSGNYFDSSNGNYITSPTEYISDRDMIVEISVSFTSIFSPSIRWTIFINGVADFDDLIYVNGFTTNVRLSPGDSLRVRSIDSFAGDGVTSGSLRITPLFIYYATGRSSVPLWTKQQFVSNILKIFNVITSYNQFTKTLTLNLFDKIKTKQSIEIGQYLNVNEIDYSDFISNYGQINNFNYQEGSDEQLSEYNISQFVKYGSGTIESNNKFIEKYKDVIESEFSSPISYIHPAFNCSLERINFVELEEDDDQEITSVSDSGGTPRFNITDANDYYAVKDLVRIHSEFINDYNGDYVVSAISTTYIEVRGLIYSTSTTGTVTKLTHVVTQDENVYLFVHIPYRHTSDITGLERVYLDENSYSIWSLAFFNLLRIGRVIESEYKQGLSFGEVNNALSFQKTLIDKYWQQFKRILNDPVKLLTTGNLPWKVYDSIDFLQPVVITTQESSNLYYVNRILGYKDSSIGCEVDLIKLP